MRHLPSILLALLLCAAPLSAQSILDHATQERGGVSHRFDLLHVAIDVRFDIPQKMVIGTVQHRMRSLDPALGSIWLDAAPTMSFSRIEVDGVPASYRHHGDTLAISLPARRRYHDTFTVAIDYRVSPTKGLYFIQPDSLMPSRREQIWTQGQEEDNHFWVPIYDHPNDRATSEVRATVPSGWKVLSNGSLLSTAPGSEPGTATWHYRMEKPHATYLIMMAAGDYLVTRDTVDGVPLEYWSYPDMPERVEPTFARTPDVLRYLSSRLGVPYPWNKYAQIMIAEFMYGGMENTTATTLNDYMLVDKRGLLDYNPDGVIAHEAAHMWFGDLVTNRSWDHLWIHESYATYLASRYKGHRYGDDVFVKDMYDNGQIAVQSQEVRGRDPLAFGDKITANIYQRGSRVLHMLHQIVGDELFWRASQLFLERHAYTLVETNDLKNAFEDATGLNLGWFFDQWVYKAGYPAYKLEKTWSEGTLTLRVRQMQVLDSLTGLFQMPVPLEFHLRDAVVHDTIWVSRVDETFSFKLPGEPRYVIFDAGDALLKTVEFQRAPEELAAQLGSARFIDRLLAAHELTSAQKLRGEGTGQRKRRSLALLDAFRREPSPFVREEILSNASTLDTDAAVDAIGQGLGDSDVNVRVAAVEHSYLIADRNERALRLRPLLADSSYKVIAATLGMLAVTDTSGLEPTLRAMKGRRGRRDHLAIAWLGSVLSGGYRSLADDVSEYTLPTFNTDTRVQAYYVLGKLDTTTVAMRDAIGRGVLDRSGIVRASAAVAARSHLDPEMRALLTRLRITANATERSTIDALLEQK